MYCTLMCIVWYVYDDPIFPQPRPSLRTTYLQEPVKGGFVAPGHPDGIIGSLDVADEGSVSVNDRLR